MRCLRGETIDLRILLQTLQPNLPPLVVPSPQKKRKDKSSSVPPHLSTSSTSSQLPINSPLSTPTKPHSAWITPISLSAPSTPQSPAPTYREQPIPLPTGFSVNSSLLHNQALQQQTSLQPTTTTGDPNDKLNSNEVYLLQFEHSKLPTLPFPQAPGAPLQTLTAPLPVATPHSSTSLSPSTPMPNSDSDLEAINISGIDINSSQQQSSFESTTTPGDPNDKLNSNKAYLLQVRSSNTVQV